MRDRLSLPPRIVSPEVRAAMREIARRDGILAIAQTEAEISLNLKLASRKVGLSPERVLTLGARYIVYAQEGRTIGEFLQDVKSSDGRFWLYVGMLAGRDKRHGNEDESDSPEAE